MPILDGLHARTLALLAEAAERVTVAPGTRVFDRGSQPTGLFFVVSGGIKLLSMGPDQRARVVELFQPGQMFGEVGVFTGAIYRTWTETFTPTTLIHIRREVVLEAVNRDHELALRLLAAVSARTQRLIDSLSSASTNTAAVRVAAYLLELADRSPAADNRLTLPASKGTIASLLNLSQESLSRVLRRMMDAGLLMVMGRRILIRDREGLAQLMDGDGAPAMPL
ncbi:MAG: Crp/Fnr family transcriptional regulator [Rhodocyclales bacterium]|nr:Crp/Fnr family transcriptional regulator [Rhodocyclales bacterium]